MCLIVYLSKTHTCRTGACTGGWGVEKVEWAMSSGSIIQGMFLLQPTSKWVGRSDSQDETLDRTNPPWLYHPECLQILHVPKEAQNIVLTRFIEKTVSVPYTYLHLNFLFSWNVGEKTTLVFYLNYLTGIKLFFNFPSRAHAPSSGH